MFVFPPNSDVEILTPKDDVLGGAGFERFLGHEDGAFMNGISVFTKETLPPCEETARKHRLWTRKRTLNRT